KHFVCRESFYWREILPIRINRAAIRVDTQIAPVKPGENLIRRVIPMVHFIQFAQSRALSDSAPKPSER
ncbi:MAG: hypothetical protein QOD03_1614, partial [Verrucomicrobiota bacterium]